MLLFIPRLLVQFGVDSSDADMLADQLADATTVHRQDTRWTGLDVELLRIFEVEKNTLKTLFENFFPQLCANNCPP